MSEMLKFRGWLVEKEIELGDMKIKMIGLRDAIRSNLSDLVPLEEMRCDIAVEQAIELAAVQIKHKELTAEIAAKKKVYGVK